MNLIFAVLRLLIYAFWPPRRRRSYRSGRCVQPRQPRYRPNTPVPPPAPRRPVASKPAALSTVESDVVSALVNMGCRRPKAESSVRQVAAAMPGAAFDELFVKSLEAVR